MLYQLSYEATHWERGQSIDLVPNVWLHSSVGRASHQYRRGHRFESRWSPDFFQASSVQLLKLENLLRWSFFTFIYNRSSNMNYFIYTSQHTALLDRIELHVMNILSSPYQQNSQNLKVKGKALQPVRRFTMLSCHAVFITYWIYYIQYVVSLGWVKGN